MRCAGSFSLFYLAAALTVGGCGASEARNQPSVPTLRVGTTGDIPPFSERTATGYRGIDIELAEDLARELGRRVDFVPTTWATLVRDVRDHRFDVAMSGIMIVPTRAMFGEFSRPYYVGRQVAVIRCAERAALTDREQINRPEVTIFVRKGGAASVNALRSFPQARLRQVDEAETAYRAVAEGTNRVLLASQYSVRAYPGLCVGLNGEALFSANVAFLAPAGSPLIHRIDAWLERRLADGTVRHVLSRFQAP